MASYVREIVLIDEEKCDGCGLCVPSCAEGAIQIIDGKAKLVGDNVCDGLGNCLGVCPQDAITIEKREADAYDEAAVEALLAAQEFSGSAAVAETRKEIEVVMEAPKQPAACGCPGSMLRKLKPSMPADASSGGSAVGTSVDPDTIRMPSQLTHWPVQIHLLPVQGEIWNNADVLIAADCVAFAMPDFHNRLLKGKTVAVGCPKLDDNEFYAGKFSNIFAGNNIKSVTVAHMEVPCCNGIVIAVKQALAAAGKTNLEFRDILVGVDGRVQSDLSNPVSMT